MDKFLNKLKGTNEINNKKKIINKKGEIEIVNYNEKEIKVLIKRYHFNYNIFDLVITDEKISYMYYSKIKYENLVNTLVRLKYNDSEEFAILRKSINYPESEEFINYYNYVESCKSKAKEWVNERDKIINSKKGE